MAEQLNETMFLDYVGLKLILNKMKDYFIPFRNCLTDKELDGILSKYFNFFGSGSGSGSGGLAMALVDEAQSMESGSGSDPMLTDALVEETNE